jgi:hypothetical protein
MTRARAAHAGPWRIDSNKDLIGVAKRAGLDQLLRLLPVSISPSGRLLSDDSAAFRFLAVARALLLRLRSV